MKPVKCPECGIWWRGREHTCPAWETNPIAVRPPDRGPHVVDPFSGQPWLGGGGTADGGHPTHRWIISSGTITVTAPPPDDDDGLAGVPVPA